jgi:hypothetical protein
MSLRRYVCAYFSTWTRVGNTERSKINIPCYALRVRQVHATFASDSRMWWRASGVNPAWIWRTCHANVTAKFAYDVRHAARVSWKCYAHLSMIPALCVRFWGRVDRALWGFSITLGFKQQVTLLKFHVAFFLNTKCLEKTIIYIYGIFFSRNDLQVIFNNSLMCLSFVIKSANCQNDQLPDYKPIISTFGKSTSWRNVSNRAGEHPAWWRGVFLQVYL